MFSVNDIAKRFGDTLLFERVSFTINPLDRIGLVGPNGAGKSTILRILAGEDTPDSGSVKIAPGITPGYLRQGFADIPHGTLADLIDVSTGGLLATHQVLEDATGLLADPDVDPDEAMIAWERAGAEFEARGGYSALADLDAVLDRFALGDVTRDRPLSTLSGGQKTRAGLAALLITRPDLLVLDEPTNHLDSNALQWLTVFLQDYRGAVLVVSHDRTFLDQVVTKILWVDINQRSVREYSGTYSDFVAARDHDEEEAEAAWQRQQAKVARIQRDIRAAESKAKSIEAGTIDYAVRKKAAKIARPAVVRKKKLERMLADEDAAVRPVRHWGLSLEFGGGQEGAREALRLDGVTVSLGDRPVLRDVDLHVRQGERVALLGANGSGKTTLMRIIAGEVVPDSGSVRVGTGVRVGYFAQEQQTLDADLTVLQHANRIVSTSEGELRAELHKFLFGGEAVHRRVADLSYGERARLMLALLVLQQTTFLLLDEPMNHLDIESREAFEMALTAFRGTMLMVLHDTYAVERLATRVIEVRDGTLQERFTVLS